LFQFSSIPQYHEQLKNRSTTCLQAVRYYIEQIERHKDLNCFLEVYTEEALERASYLDSQPVRGKLHGVVIGLKDNICYKGHKVSASSLILKDFVSVYSATAVKRLLEEGAIIIGRQNCDEFGMGSTNENSAYGPVLNPNNPELVPGGSSGGSAAAVKAGLCMAALGSDTGGSVRLPADFCGIVGLKPAYGSVSRYGLLAYASSFDQIGVLANTMDDAVAILNVISGPDAYDSTAITEKEITEKATSENQKFRIAYFPEWIEHPSVDPEIAAAINNLLNNLKSQGHTVEPVHFTLTDYIVPTYYILTTAEASSNLARYDGVRYGPRNSGQAKDLANFYRLNRKLGFGKEVKRRILLGTFVLSAGYYDAYYTKAQQVRQLLKSQTDLIFRDYNILIAPNAPTPAYKIGEKSSDSVAMYMGDIFTVFASLTGIPAVSLPVFKHSSSISFGLQAMSGGHNVVFLQRFTHQLMQQ
jgi:aspartyl-tRNA(Asn)/glutamyl-tRNA(Gln) amidotransferase subunit A